MSSAGSALRNPNFALYLVGSVFNTNGTWIQRLTLGWLAWETTHSEFWVGVVAFVLFAPVVVLGPLFGVLADRMERRRAASYVLSYIAAATVVMSVLTGTGNMNSATLAGGALMFGVGNSAYHPLRLTLVAGLVPRQQLRSAVALGAIVFNVSRLVGPAVAALLIALGGPATALAVNAALYLPMLVILRLVRFSGQPRPSQHAHVFAELLSGVRYATASAAIARYLALAAIIALFGRGVLELLPAFAGAVYARGSTGLAVLTSSAGAGAIVAGVLLSRLQSALDRLVVGSALATGALVCLLGLTPAFWPGAVLVLCLGFAITLCGVGTQSLIQLDVDDAYRGRVMSLWGAIAFGGTALGGLTVGAISELSGLGPATTGWGLACLLAIAAALAWQRRRAALALGK